MTKQGEMPTSNLEFELNVIRKYITFSNASWSKSTTYTTEQLYEFLHELREWLIGSKAILLEDRIALLLGIQIGNKSMDRIVKKLLPIVNFVLYKTTTPNKLLIKNRPILVRKIPLLLALLFMGALTATGRMSVAGVANRVRCRSELFLYRMAPGIRKQIPETTRLFYKGDIAKDISTFVQFCVNVSPQPHKIKHGRSKGSASLLYLLLCYLRFVSDYKKNEYVYKGDN